jgi:hypothetical protein
MTPIKDDGTIDLPAEARDDFASFLRRHGVPLLEGSRIVVPFEHDKIQSLYGEWLETKNPASRKEPTLIKPTLTLILPLILLGLFASMLVLYSNIERAPPDDGPRAEVDAEVREERGPVGNPRGEDRKAEERPVDVDAVLRSLGTGNIAFDVPQTMKLGETTPIQLLLSARESIDQLKQKLDSAQHAAGATIKVSDVMEATLYGRGFDVHPLTPERQAISNSDRTEWKWDITAKEPGTQDLRLTISVVITVNGHEAPRVLDVYQRTIEVHVAIGTRISEFLSTNWQWLLGLCAGLPTLVFGWLVATRRSRKNRRIWAKLSSGGYIPNQK